MLLIDQRIRFQRTLRVTRIAVEFLLNKLSLMDSSEKIQMFFLIFVHRNSSSVSFSKYYLEVGLSWVRAYRGKSRLIRLDLTICACLIYVDEE